MKKLLNKIFKLLAVFPAMALMAFANIFICFSAAAVVMMQLLSAGMNKYSSLGAAILVAIGVHTYIVFNHKLRNYINVRGANNE